MHKPHADTKQDNDNQVINETSCASVSKSSKREKSKNERKKLKGKTSEWRDKSKPNQMNISYQRDTKKAKTQGHQTIALPSIQGMCWNVKGMTTVLEELTKLAHDHDPDFIVITETKLRNKGLGRQRLAAALPDYRLHTSCKKDASSTRQGERTGAAGVAIAQKTNKTCVRVICNAEQPSSSWTLPTHHPATSGKRCN